MASKTLYLDCAASAPVFPELSEQSKGTEELLYANPSARHRLGAGAAKLLCAQRERAAELFGLRKEQIVFCSAATEANNLAIYNDLLPKLFHQKQEPGQKTQNNTIFACSSTLDHPSCVKVLNQLKPWGLNLRDIPLSADGALLLSRTLEREQDRPHLFSTITGVDGETGRKQELPALSQVISAAQERRKGKGLAPIYIHADLSQYLACETNLSQFGLFLQEGFDSISISGQKIGAGRGAGILLQRSPAHWALSQGGGQEGGQRSGTENLSAIVSLIYAIEQSNKQYASREGLSKAFLKMLAGYPNISVQPEYRLENPAYFSPFIFSLAAPPLPAEVLQRLLSEQGYMVGTGSACHSKASNSRSQKLLGQGYSPAALKSILRISFGTGASSPSEEDLAAFLRCLGKLQSVYA